MTKKHPFLFALAALGILLAGGGCTASAVGSYQSTGTYRDVLDSELALRARSFHGPGRNPVVIIHGFLGARLTAPGGEMIWGKFSAAAMTERELQLLAHPMMKDKSLRELEPESFPTGILEAAEVRFAGIDFQLPGYELATRMLRGSGYTNDLFSFAYDWRRDLPETAAKLHEFLTIRRAALQKEYERLYGVVDYDVKFDLVAHSMGGLVARYFLMYGKQDLPADGQALPELDWSGSKLVDKVLVVGTPNDGYLDTLREMVEGLVLTPGAPRLPAGVIATFPSYYQMLPGLSGGYAFYEGSDEGETLDLFDPDLWIRHRWGLADPRNERYFRLALPGDFRDSEEATRGLARDHLRKCLGRAAQFRRALSRPVDSTGGSEFFLFAGDAVKTAQSVAVDRESGKLLRVDYGSGDGKILISSARFDRLSKEAGVPPFSRSPIPWRVVNHIRAAHMGLFASDEFKHNARYYLLMYPTATQCERFGLDR